MNIDEKIENAIQNHKTILINTKYGLGQELEVEFDPYIIGSDTMQYGFVWGFLPWNNLMYKFILNNLLSVKITDKTFKVQSDVIYLYAIEEEHYYSVTEMYEPEVRVYAQALAERKPE